MASDGNKLDKYGEMFMDGNKYLSAEHSYHTNHVIKFNNTAIPPRYQERIIREATEIKKTPQFL